ncbi:MAG: S-layer homology domain-containing protein [Clostridiales bacterium]|jgi:hypothetical protein|nr:S-layer homology domain-containing protein [Clostridiales bacterium]
MIAKFLTSRSAKQCLRVFSFFLIILFVLSLPPAAGTVSASPVAALAAAETPAPAAETSAAPAVEVTATPAPADGSGGDTSAPAPATPPPPAGDLSAQYADLTQDEKALILNRLGVLKGDPNIGLMLDIKVRRSDAAVFFTRLLGQEQYVVDRAETDFAISRFPDAPKGMWYTPYIAYCTNIGIVAGRTDGKYYPDDNISEKEFANVLLKILGYAYEQDYTWDTVYEFAYDIGLFEDAAYATRKEDNREYFRKDVCDQVFAALGLEKKDSPKLLIEELVESGAISYDTAHALEFDLSGLSDTAISGGQTDGQTGDGRDVDDFADIYAIYHVEADLIWVVFTKDVTVRADDIEICQTYDYSRTLSVRVEDMTARDLLIRTSQQEPNMDYTIDIGNVLEADGTNAGMLSFDFVGYNPSARKDEPAGLTSLKRGETLPGSGGGSAPAGASPAPSSASTSSGDAASPSPTASPSGSSASPTGAGAGGNADPSVEYFRVVNAYTTAADQVVLYFSQPISETALTASYYNICQNGAILSSGATGQISAALLENTNNAVRLTVSGLKFSRGAQYQATVSGRLISGYTAKLNEGAEDSYFFTADAVTDRGDAFSLKTILTTSQYVAELEFSQPVNAEVAKQSYNYLVVDQNGRKLDVSAVTVVPSSGSGTASGASGSGVGAIVRLNFTQQLAIQQNYTLTVIYAQNAAQNASIANVSFPFQYGGQGASTQRSTLALTGAVSNDPATAELYFNQKLDAASAVVNSNYAVNGMFDGRNYTISPIKVSYDPILTPYMVRLYFQTDRKFTKDVSYTVRVAGSIRDEKKLSPDRTLEMQFFANNRDLTAPGLKDAATVGEGLVRLDFSKEIAFDPSKITESNFSLEDLGNGGGGSDPLISPILVKYINSTTIILKFDGLDMTRKYRARFGTITDYSGQYTSRYPDQGSAIAVRAGKK